MHVPRHRSHVIKPRPLRGSERGHRVSKVLACLGAVAFFASIGLPACKPAPRDRDRGLSTAPPQSATDAIAPGPPRRTRLGGTDVTFLVASDLHFGFGYPDDLKKLSADAFAQPVGLESANRVLVTRMNALSGHAYPSDVGGFVTRPRGVLVTGDLTEWGRKEEWDRFVSYFGLTGKEGALRLPVFEAVGNHDKIHGPWIEEQVAIRHGGRFYAWDWDDLHLVSLGEAPDDEGLAWLARNLDGLARDVPIILYFHRALLGPWSEDNWFGDGTYRDRLAKILQDHMVLAIFHGHHHAAGHYLWHGIDVYKPGAVKDDAHTLAVVHVTDSNATVAYYNYDDDAWTKSFQKKQPR